jgi:serine/threonine protein kinase/tetratricopeptide (TPR) repeat protein
VAELESLARALKDHYTVQRELGRGGMATVYLAEDLKHHRLVAIKVLRPELAAVLGPDRFLREIEIAARLAHPHILPLYDSGTASAGNAADAFLYYVMPYVDGESLRDRLDGERQLPIDDALQIAREVADALSYAHSHGVIHRDIKPANILLQSGHAVVADFGIARAIDQAGGERVTATGVAVGTPAYMSPEQGTGERDLDGRSDLYSLGCVLFEMLAGEPPFMGPTAQAIIRRRLTDPLPRISVIRETVPPSVEAALARVLARAPVDRFATGGQFAAALSAPVGGVIPHPLPWRWRRPALIGGVVVTALVGAGVLELSSSSGIGFAARDWVVVADFENGTGDSVFEGSLGSALTVGLQQSRYVNILPRLRIAQLLEEMKQPDTTRLDPEVARQVALRANIRVLVVPAISRIDSTYLLTTRIVDPPTGSDLLTRSVRAQGKGKVLTALDGLVRRLRRDLGESRSAVAQDGMRLDQATTPSLEALRAWTEGNRYWNHQRFDDAAARYRRALSLDSSFAMAHATLAQYFAWQARRDSSDYHFAQAMNQLDRVTERERLIIQAAFNTARANWDASIQALETLVDRYPDDVTQRFNLGSTYMRAERPADAIRTLRQVVAVDSTNVAAFINLATTYAGADSAAVALPYYRRAFALRPEYLLAGNLNHEYGFTLVALGRLDSAEATFRAMLSGDPEQQAGGHRSLALLRMYQGRYAEARSHLERAVRLTRATGAPLSEFRNELYLASAWAGAGNMPAFRSALRAAAAIGDTVFLAPLWLARLAVGYARLGDTLALKRVAARITQRASVDSREDQVAVNGTEALLALARGRYPRAVELLQQVMLASADSRAMYRHTLAAAYRLSGDTARAEATWRDLLQSGHVLGWEAQESWILARYELGKLSQERGDTAGAVERYRQLVDIWKDGDPDLVALADARRRLRALQPGPASSRLESRGGRPPTGMALRSMSVGRRIRWWPTAPGMLGGDRIHIEERATSWDWKPPSPGPLNFQRLVPVRRVGIEPTT